LIKNSTVYIDDCSFEGNQRIRQNVGAIKFGNSRIFIRSTNFVGINSYSGTLVGEAGSSLDLYNVTFRRNDGDDAAALVMNKGKSISIRESAFLLSYSKKGGNIKVLGAPSTLRPLL